MSSLEVQDEQHIYQFSQGYASEMNSCNSARKLSEAAPSQSAEGLELARIREVPFLRANPGVWVRERIKEE
jgi:hypothetical protein